jgi:phosphoribosylaminoimidazole-succinocarboxamide synthase
VEELAGRSMLVKKARRLDIEAVVRGYLAGSGWKDYRREGAVCGVSLPGGLKEADRLPEPIFTPAAKNDTGHDENIPLARMIEIVGEARAEEVRRTSLALYRNMAAWSESRGVILADTKFEFGLVDDRLTLIDEVGTPDSSRYWDAALYRPGQSPPSFDKQFVRDWLESSGWNKEPPAPALPADVVAKTVERYQEAARRLTGAEMPLHFSEARWNWT